MRTGTAAVILGLKAMVLLWWPGIASSPAAASQRIGGETTSATDEPGSRSSAPAEVSQSVESPADTRSHEATTPAASKVLVLGSVFPPSGTESLRPDATRLLDGIAATYKGTSQKLEIVGHADGRGDAATNLRLSAGRAQAVRAYLTASEIPAQNMTVSYEGARTPMAQGIDPEANAQNSRVEIRVP